MLTRAESGPAANDQSTPFRSSGRHAASRRRLPVEAYGVHAAISAGVVAVVAGVAVVTLLTEHASSMRAPCGCRRRLAGGARLRVMQEGVQPRLQPQGNGALQQAMRRDVRT